MMRRLWYTLSMRRLGFGTRARLGVGLWAVALAALPVGGAPGAAASTEPFFQTHYDTIPNFAQNPTIRSRASGDWANPNTWDAGRVPAATDVVAIVTGHTVTIRTQTATAKTVGVWAGALLTFDPQQDTRLTVGTLLVMPGGALEVGTAAAPVSPDRTAEIVIADQPLDRGADPDQYGTGLLVIDGRVTLRGAVKTPTFVRLATEPQQGQTSLTASQPVSGWRKDDRLVLPDSRHLSENEWWANYVLPQWEDLTLQNDPVAGSLSLSRALRFTHPGARNGDGVVDFFPHVGNVTRNVKIRSANPNGTRGHTFFTSRAAVDLRYVEFRHLGRTTQDDLDPVTNHIGRYPLHMHHVRGPVNPSNQGYQFQLIGNAVTDGTKWSITIHDSHFGLIQENVVFNGQGAGIVTEDGNESQNEFVGNFVMAVQGWFDPRNQDGRDGSAFWFHGFNHRLRNNVAADAVGLTQSNVSGSGYSFNWSAASSKITPIPRYRGADFLYYYGIPDDQIVGQEGVDFELVDMQLVPIPEFTGNEAYGATATGLVIWTLGTSGYGESDIGETLLKDFTAWHVHLGGFFAYPIQNVTFDGFVVRGDPDSRPSCCGHNGWSSGDYWAGNVTIRRANIQGMVSGIGCGSTDTPGTFTIEDSYFRTLDYAICPTTLATPGTGAFTLGRTTIIRNVKFNPWPGTEPSTIIMDYLLDVYGNPQGGTNYVQLDQVFVYDYNQVKGDNFQVFYLAQAPNFIVPQSVDAPGAGERIIGSPEAGLTNAQNWAKYGIAIAGAVAPCATTRDGISGFVCASGPPPPTATLTIVKAGTGTGTVTSADGFIACGATCTHTYPTNTSVSLTAAPAAGSTFAGWSGPGCNDTVVLSSNRTCTATFSSATPPLTLTSLTADPTSPQPVGMSILFTANATGGTPPYQAKWWLSTNGGASYTVVRDWGPDLTFPWTPTQPNPTYRVGVWLKSAGNGADMYEAGGAIPYVITGSSLTLISLTATPPSPQAVGTPITFTAMGSGGTPPYQAKWWLSTDGGAHYTVAREWGPDLTFPWTPTQPNPTYRVGVWLKSAGNGADMWEAGGAVPFAITAGAPLTMTGLTADRASPQPVGTSILFTVNATGGTPPYQAKWWLSTDGGAHYSVAREWGPDLTFPWTPTQPNPNYRVGVWLRSAGNGADMYDAGGAIPFVISAGSVPDWLAIYTLSPGWATFGMALPQGAARDGVQVGGLPTQTDVKTRWPDGSIRFAVVTARVEMAGSYQVTAARPSSGTFGPAVPVASVRLIIGGVPYTATLPRTVSTDAWLAGPLVSEWRSVVTPLGSSGPHPFLRVSFDTRVYANGQSRLDVTVENVLDQAGATTVTYDAEIFAGTQSLFRRQALEHYYLTRWRKVFGLNGFAESHITPDFTPFEQANAIPRYMPSAVRYSEDDPSGPQFDLMGVGDLQGTMYEHGGRPEIAPYPNWAARYLVHKNPQQRQYVLAHGDLAGSWPMHVREADGSFVSIDQRPDYWLDDRAPDGNKPAGGPLPMPLYSYSPPGPGQSPNVPDIAHQPSLAFIPYLVTGDRYSADEMAFWANFVLLRTFQDGFYNSRGGGKDENGQPLHPGSWGFIVGNETRGVGWGLRNMADAAAYLPDADPLKPYLAEKVAHNLAWLEEFGQTQAGPLGVAFHGAFNVAADDFWGSQPDPPLRVKLWFENFAAWGIQRANDHGFAGGETYRNGIARFQLQMLTPPCRPYNHYTIVLGTHNTWFTTMAEVCPTTERDHDPAADPSQDWPGYDQTGTLLMLNIALRNGWDARAAYDFLARAMNPGPGVINDGWWITADAGVTLPSTATLTIAKAGTGSGTLTSADGGIDCGPTCSHTYDRNTAVRLTASAAAGSTFSAWSGGGAGSRWW